MNLCRTSGNEEEYKRIQQQGIPIVFFDRVPESSEVTKVIVDDYVKSFFLVEHLIRTGRRRIVHLQGPDYIRNAMERKRAYADALSKFNIPYEPALVISAGVSVEGGRQAVKRLQKEGISFDAVFAFTDTLAIGAMNYLQEQGVLIPEEVAVAGFSGTILSTIVHPPLTTVEQPLHRIGETAARLLIEKLDHPQTVARTVVLKAEIKIRQSTLGTLGISGDIKNRTILRPYDFIVKVFCFQKLVSSIGIIAIAVITSVITSFRTRTCYSYTDDSSIVFRFV